MSSFEVVLEDQTSNIAEVLQDLKKYVVEAIPYLYLTFHWWKLLILVIGFLAQDSL